MRWLIFLLSTLVCSQAQALDSLKPSSSIFDVLNVNKLVIQGPNSTGDVSGLTVSGTKLSSIFDDMVNRTKPNYIYGRLTLLPTDVTGDGGLGPDDYTFLIRQSLTGASASPIGVNKTLFLTTSDNLSVTPGSPGNFLNGVTVQHNFGGPKTSGGRQGLFVNMTQEAPSSANNNNRNYVAAAFKIRSGGDGGTSLTTDARGGPFAFGADATLSSTATNMFGLSVGELNIAAEAGSSLKNKSILSLAAFGNDMVAGLERDAAMIFTAQGRKSVGWRDMILFSSVSGGFPFNSATNLLRTEGGAFANGVDLTASTISGSAFMSPGFAVSGNGRVNAKYLYTPANSIQIAAPLNVTAATPGQNGQIGVSATGAIVFRSRDTWYYLQGVAIQ